MEGQAHRAYASNLSGSFRNPFVWPIQSRLAIEFSFNGGGSCIPSSVMKINH